MIIGAHYLTQEIDGGKGEGRVFRDLRELYTAYEAQHIDLHAKITFRAPKFIDTPANGVAETYHVTTVGRVFFNSILPDEFPLVNEKIGKRHMGVIVDDLARNYPKAVVGRSLDGLKDMWHNL